MGGALGFALTNATSGWVRKLILRNGLLFLGSLVFSTFLFAACELSTGRSDTPLTAGHSASCDPEMDLSNLIKRLAVEDRTQGQQTRTLLLQQSKRSLACRSEIIRLLAQEMKIRNQDFIADRASYNLWFHGSVLLGDLKAVEALDLLIEHLDWNDGSFSASLAHQPAVLGIEQMGVVAVPKLSVALQHHERRNVRLAAALCLLDIGGPEAMKALSQALRSESDPCVRKLIQVGDEISKSEQRSKLTSVLDSETGYRMKLRRELLLAFKCHN